MKRMFALLLTLAMLMGLMPTAMAAEAGQAASGTTVQATELSGVSRLDSMERSEGRQPAAQPLYSDDDIVTVIVQLDGPSLLDYYNQMGGQAVFGEDSSSGEAYTAGEAVSAFLDLPEVQDVEDELLAGQQSFLSQIGGPRATTFSVARSAEPEVEVVAQWTTVLNGMAIRVPYGSLASIQTMDGVKRAYVQHVYAAPEPVIEGAGAAGFSYDMVDLSTAWGAGYTGKGMLVAVIDTGLDLEYASFSVDQENGSWINVTDIRRTHEAFRDNSFKTEFPDSELRYTRETISTFLREHELQAHKIITTNPIAVSGAAYKNRKVVYAFDYIGQEYSTDLYGDVNVYPGQFGNTHGTHVAGTVAGYAETEEGEVIFSGIAPDAQLAIMKVFPDQNGGAPETATMCALEDAMILGADVVNLSLGSDNGYADDDSAQAQIYASVAEAGVVIMTAAGNAAYSSTGNERDGYNLSSDPEIAMVGSPSVYPSTLSVASINNTVTSQMTLVWSDGENEYKIPFTDPFDTAMKTDFAQAKMPEGGYEIVPVGGTGTWQDYSDAGFRSGYYGYGDPGKTGIALVQRGELSFIDKVKNAQSFKWSNYQQGQMVNGGVRGVLVYDNVEGELVNMSISLTDGVTMTSAFISKEAGEAMIAAINDGKTVTLKWVNQEDEIADYAGGYEMSSFTSWGAAPGLELKPEITAPGGNIWSTIIDQSYEKLFGYYDDYVGTYEMMSGTSMAAPHMTGLGALVRQYVQTEELASGADAATLTNQLLVSTAVPQAQKEKDSDKTAFYSPRRQGAGLVNIGAAITTPAYITVDGQMVGKLELKDDPNWTGSYDLKFTVHNMTEYPVGYNIQAVMQRPDTKTEDGHTLMLDSDVLIKTVDLGSVIIPANGEVTVSKTITLTADEIDALKELFPNGTYIEGFITLNGARVPQIGLPYLAFLGDWTAAPIFDSVMWYDQAPEGWEKENESDPDWNPYDNGDYTWWPSVIGSTVYNEMYGTMEAYNLGQNVFDSTSGTSQMNHHTGNFTISPNGDEYFDRVDDIELYQLRDAKLMVVEVRDADTKELYYRDLSTYNFKTLYDSNYSAAIPSSLYYFTPTAWVGTDLDGNRLPSGTRCIYTITAYGEGEYGDKVEYEGYDYLVTNFEGVDPTDPSTEPTFNGHPMDKTGDVISFPIVVDYEAPMLVNNAISIETREDGHTYLTGTVHDADGSIASVEVVPVVTMTRTYNGTSESSTAADLQNPFYSKLIYDEAVQEWTFEADVTAYTRQSYPGYMTYEWTGAVHIYCGDYGANDRAYIVAVEGMDTPGELLLSHTSARLHPGSAFDMSVTDNTGSGLPITRASTNPEVATVDEFGTVTAVAPGQTTIVVTNGVKTAYCVVAVEDWPTEVIDFDLSMEYFPGLKPNGVFMVKVTNLQPADVILTEKGWQVFEDDPELYEGLVTCEKYGADGLSAWIRLNSVATGDPEIHVPGQSGTLKVTLNGVVREMHFDWEDLYTYYSTYSGEKDEDLISAANSEEQTVYVTVGETATLVAKYNDSSAHNVHPVELFGAQKRDENGQVTEYYPASVGLVLDGKPYGASNSSWTGKLVTKEGYTLPERITISERRPDASEPGGYYEYTRWDSGSSYDTYNHSYNKETGEIFVRYIPTGNASLVIRADGVVSEGAPAGEVSGTEYEMPDGMYGPFDWTMTTGLPEGVTSAGGTLEPFENGLINSYNTGNGAHFTPDKPGVSYITATSKDGQYSVNFAVVCEPVKAERLDLDERRLELEVGDDPVKLTATLTPEPTLDSDKELIWTSFNPDVATVDQDGNITAVGEGYAYIKVAVEMDTTIQSCCVVQVGAVPEVEFYTISYNLNGGRISDSAPAGYVTIDKAQTLSIPEPTKANCTFLGWTYAGQTTPTKTITLPAGFSGALTLTANWEQNFVPPVDPVVPVVPDTPSTDTPEPQPSDGVSTSDKEEDGVTTTETTAVLDSTVDGSSASADVSATMGDEIVKQAVDNESETVVIAPKMDDTVTSAEVSIPAAAVSEIAEKTEADVRIETPVATVVIPNEALADLAADGGQVAVSAQRTDDDTVEVTVQANGQQVDSVTGGMTVTVPQEDCGPGTVAMLVLEDGTTQVIRQSLASADGQSINIPLDGSAKLVIVDNSQTFTDVSDTNWAADAIAFASSHELMNGIGGGAFDPKAPMTRGMLATVLHNLENNQSADTSTVFSDVRDGAWYSDAIQWAAGKGIVNGYPDGSFAPKESISREQLAVMLYRYAGSPEVSDTALNFADADNISGYAKEAMTWAVENHILQGKGNGVLDPKGDATRAETAQMLLNFMTNIIW